MKIKKSKNLDKEAMSLIEALADLQGAEELKSFMLDLLSQTEIREFSRRWKAAEMLYQGLPYSEIELETGLSSATIARVSRCVSGEVGGYKRALERRYLDISPDRLAAN